MQFEAMAREGRIGNVVIKNRIVLPPLNNNYTRAGFMTEESKDFYVSRAKGGCGLIIMEATSVDYPRSRSVLNPALDEDQFIQPIKEIIDECHQYGAKVMIQLSHVGRQTRRSTTGQDPVAPSPLANKSSLYPDTPRPLTIPDIKEIIGMFGDAAARAKAADADGVELILGHGYLANNFLTPESNRRDDEYGGLKGGVKYCVEIVRAIKARCGEDFPVICRLNGDDYIKKDGNTVVEAQLIAQELERAGVDAIHVTAGMRDSDLNFNDHTAGMPLGAWLHLSERIRNVINIPVIAVKRLTPEIAEQAILDGKANFVAFGKQYIADPDLADKILSGRLEDIIPCTSCCQGCYDMLYTKKPIGCMINQDVGRPMDYRARRDALRGSKKVLVVGAGPAGCEAALEAAKKGHSVTLIDQAPELGGQYASCQHTRHKKRIADVFAFMAREMAKCGVDVRLDTPFSVELVDALKPQAVIDATGAAFKRPAIEGADLPIVVDPDQALDGSHPIGNYVAVVTCGHNCTWLCHTRSEPISDDVVGLKTNETYACGAGHAAADVAEELAARGKKVSIVTGRDAFVPGMGYTNRGNMHKRFFPADIVIANNVKVKRVTPDGLVCEKEGMEFNLYADTVVLSLAMQPRDDIEKQLAGRDVEFFRVGDAAEVGNALLSFRSGYEVVDRL